jgi:hypothetical protein
MVPLGTYDVGDGVRVTTQFKNLAGTLTNPTVVTCQVKDPSGTITTPTPTLSSAGIYYTDITLSTNGNWYVRFAGTGLVIAAVEGHIKVLESNF